MYRLKVLSLLLVAVLVLAACGGGDDSSSEAPAEEAAAAEEAPAEEEAAEEGAAEEEEAAEEEAPAEEEAAEEEAAADMSDVVFFSTQFNIVEEAEKFRNILAEGGFNFTETTEQNLATLILAEAEAGEGTIDVFGALHGEFPPFQREDALMNMIDVADDLMADRDLAAAFLDTGLLGTDDHLYYVPWMQATYIMGASVEALDYLPEGADVNALTWEQFGEWCKNIMDETGEAKCGLPKAGLFHRFLEGYMWPSWTGGMVSTFASDDAVAMFDWVQADLWPYVSPESINYEFMQEPMLAGEVWVAFDHSARLLEAFNSDPEGFVAFPAPAGPYGRGFMPVVVGLGIPNTAPNPDGGAALIDYLTTPEVQGQILSELGFFPVVAGVDTNDLPPGITIEAGAVEAQAAAEDALPALLPVGLGDRGGEINQIFNNAFDRIVLDGEDAATVLAEEGANLQALMDETGAPCWAPDAPSEGPCQVQ